ncbi:anthranilate synthase component 1 [Catenovulum sediminis]|uniref:anthranilate synthase component 1 n=1 Tax=Catenovulum sediminis TaxID=1740262 RepID=UPI00117DD29E|nr:anthranilate synthase component 1 [Catenovulum sediminis]
MKTQLITNKKSTQYIADPLTVYSTLAKDHTHSLLLESAEIDSKDNLKSILLLDACLRLECNGHQVIAQALNTNAGPVLNYLKDSLQKFVIQDDNASITFAFPLPLNELNEDERLKTANPFEVLRVLLTIDNPDAPLFLGGVFGYDMLAVVESLPDASAGENTCPDYLFYLAENTLVCDHQNQTAELTCYSFSAEHASSAKAQLNQYDEQLRQISAPTDTIKPASNKPEVRVDVSDEEFCQSVVKLKQHIKKGDIFQVVPSRTFSLPCVDSVAAYKMLKKQNPSPYMFYMRDQEFELFGASPESAVKYTKQDNEVEIYPIAGTRRRGFNPDGSINLDLDSRIEQELRSDQKELAEHMMLVDLARNDVARVSEPGTRHVCDLQKVDRYSFVMHLVSRVKGQLRRDLDALHAYQACLNMGTLVGAPKVRAAELIRHTEQKRRGSYGGAVGYLTSRGDMDTCIVIRSAFVKDKTAHVQAGAGVVYDSIPQSEADETRSKAQAVINAIISAQEA